MNKTPLKLNPWWVTGFSDAESTFVLLIFKSSTIKLGWQIQLKFVIKLHKKDLIVLEQIKEFFGEGNIYVDDQFATYSVTSFKDLNSVIIPHFTKYPLMTQKLADFLLFKQAIEILKEKKYLL